MQLSGLQALKYINLNSCGLTSVPEVGSLPRLVVLLLVDHYHLGGIIAHRSCSIIAVAALLLKSATLLASCRSPVSQMPCCA